MINILLGFLIVVAVILSLWSIHIKRKHGNSCGSCGTGCGNSCGSCGSSCFVSEKDENE